MKEILSKYKDWKTVPLPEIMKNLPLDSRGFPVPENVQWIDNKPVFAANDTSKELWLYTTDRCAVSGVKLHPSTVRLITSPLNAIRDEIVVADSPIHVDAMIYALKVCPYLALGKYYKGFSLDRDQKLAEKYKGFAFQQTSPVETIPPFMVAIHPEEIQGVMNGHVLMFRVKQKNVRSMKFYKHGLEISKQQAAQELYEYMKEPEIEDRMDYAKISRGEAIHVILTT